MPRAQTVHSHPSGAQARPGSSRFRRGCCIPEYPVGTLAGILIGDEHCAGGENQAAWPIHLPLARGNKITGDCHARNIRCHQTIACYMLRAASNAAKVRK